MTVVLGLVAWSLHLRLCGAWALEVGYLYMGSDGVLCREGLDGSRDSEPAFLFDIVEKAETYEIHYPSTTLSQIIRIGLCRSSSVMGLGRAPGASIS